MSKLIAIIKIVAQLLPAIIEAIGAIEAAIPQSGQGAQKLAMVREIVEAAFESVQDASVTFAEVWPAIQRLVAKLVTAFNGLGVFNKASA
jgi:capsid protein